MCEIEIGNNVLLRIDYEFRLVKCEYYRNKNKFVFLFDSVFIMSKLLLDREN